MKTKTKISAYAYILRSAAVMLLFSCVIAVLSSAINRPYHTPNIPAPKDKIAFGANGKERGTSVSVSVTRGSRTLSFTDRVAYQRAIEEIYWQHRIWPKANNGHKPTLDSIMSYAEIEKKVEDYLRDSQALEHYWQKPITPDQLQAEMERIASHTKQPGVLREIFSALGNDPSVIAECLARPVLAERLLTELYAHDQRFHGELKRRAEAELKTHRNVQQMKQTLPAAASRSDAGAASGIYTEMEWIKSDSAETGSALAEEKNVEALKLSGREWQESIAKVAAQFGSEDIVGHASRPPQDGLAVVSLPNEEAAALEKLPIAQIKTGVLSPLREDDGHYYAVAVMKKGNDRLKLATVAWLKEPLRSWLAKAEAQVPPTMAAVSANYTLPVISDQLDNSIPSGICTDDSWTPTSTTNTPDARDQHTAVWTGSEMIIWGGQNFTIPAFLNTGGRYNPSTDSWTATSTTGAPSARRNHTAVWTGSQMIVWGGYGSPSGPLNTGGRYNPGTDGWSATSLTSAPDVRLLHTAVWTGSEMIVWGGFGGSPPGNYFNTGGRYSPSTDSWTATGTTGAPSARESQTAVWTGSQMIVWGGVNDSSFGLNTGGRYNASTDSWSATSLINAPDRRNGHSGVWTDSQMIVWGGVNDISGFLNTGGRYNPGTDSWTATSTTNAPDARGYHKAVWTGSETIVWGGSRGCDTTCHHFNTGGRYNPGNDSWTATTTTNAPVAREGHTAVWIGSEMIVWGGSNDLELDTGGRYCAQGGPSPTPTATATPTVTATATPTPTPTPTPCIGRCSPTPRPRPTPAPRP